MQGRNERDEVRSGFVKAEILARRGIRVRNPDLPVDDGMPDFVRNDIEVQAEWPIDAVFPVAANFYEAEAGIGVIQGGKDAELHPLIARSEMPVDGTVEITFPDIH